MQFRDLGMLRVDVDDLEVPLPGRRIASVLARLLASVGEPVSTDALVEATWGEQPPARAFQALETVVWRLRSALEPGRSARATATVVRKSADGYVLAVPQLGIDPGPALRAVQAAVLNHAPELDPPITAR